MTAGSVPSGPSRRESSAPPDAVLIDGYNLLHAIPRFAPRGADLVSARAQLERWLAETARRRGAREVVLVWDGSREAAPGLGYATSPVKVLFSSPGESADERLLALCRGPYAANAARTWVVSSDHDVQAPARDLGFEVMGAMAFFRRWSDARPRGGCTRERERAQEAELAGDEKKPRPSRRDVEELLEEFLADRSAPNGANDSGAGGSSRGIAS